MSLLTLGNPKNRFTNYRRKPDSLVPVLDPAPIGTTSMTVSEVNGALNTWDFLHGVPDITTDRVCIFMHGDGERGTDLNDILTTGWDNPIKNANDGSGIYNAHILAPQLPASSSTWSGGNSNWPLLWNWLVANIDPSPKVCITGYSLGGGGCYNLLEFKDWTEFPMWGHIIVAGFGVISPLAQSMPNGGTAYHSDPDNTVSYSQGVNANNSYNNQRAVDYPELVLNPAPFDKDAGAGHSIATDIYNNYFPGDLEVILNINQ